MVVPEGRTVDCFAPVFDYIWRGRPLRNGFLAVDSASRGHVPSRGDMRIGNAASGDGRDKHAPAVSATRPPVTPPVPGFGRGAGRTERPMDAIVKPWPKGSNPANTLSDHVRN